MLSNDPGFITRILSEHTEKEYWVQVEGIPDEKSLEPLRKGVQIRAKKTTFTTLPATVKILDEPQVPERTPPIRFRKNIPTSWLSIVIREGKNRQVRKMTAAIGFPTLRLIRVRIAKYTLGDMKPGQVQEIT